MKLLYASLILCPAMLLLSCAKKNNETAQPAFRLLKKDATGLDFENVLHQSGEFNIFNYMYFFNGGGVGAGDFNNDGQTDLFFTSNMGQSKMFLNQGGLKFKDVTQETGISSPNGWTTGVSVVDINKGVVRYGEVYSTTFSPSDQQMPLTSATVCSASVTTSAVMSSSPTSGNAGICAGSGLPDAESCAQVPTW